MLLGELQSLNQCSFQVTSSVLLKLEADLLILFLLNLWLGLRKKSTMSLAILYSE